MLVNLGLFGLYCGNFGLGAIRFGFGRVVVFIKGVIVILIYVLGSRRVAGI